MRKLLLLAVGAAGYVLGTRAGRERYEQIKGMAVKVKDDPRVQEKAHQATDLAKEKDPVVKDKVASAAGSAAGTVGDKVGTVTDKVGSHKDTGALEDQLNPDNVALQDNPYPQGDLP